MARLYSNENFPLPVVRVLRVAGHDILTSHEAGKSNLRIPDEQVLEFANSLDRAVLTLNRQDFIKLHRTNKGHRGIIVCTVDAEYEALATRIHAEVIKFVSLDGRLIRVNRPG